MHTISLRPKRFNIDDILLIIGLPLLIRMIERLPVPPAGVMLVAYRSPLVWRWIQYYGSGKA